MPGCPLSRLEAAQMLCDAGCSKPFIQQFLTAMETKSAEDQLDLLRGQRNRQLQRMHDETKKLDMLDDLRYRLEKQSSSSENQKVVRAAG